MPTKKSDDSARAGAKRVTWPGDPDGTVESRIKAESEDQARVRKQRGTQETVSPALTTVKE